MWWSHHRKYVESFFSQHVVVHLPQCHLLKIGDVLVQRGYVSVVDSYAEGTDVSALQLVEIFRRIAVFTLGSNAPFRYMTTDFIGYGDAAWGYRWVPISMKSVKRALSVLVETGLVLRLSSRNEKAYFYAINLEKVLPLVLKDMNSVQQRQRRLDDVIALTQELYATPRFLTVCKVLSMYDGKTLNIKEEERIVHHQLFEIGGGLMTSLQSLLGRVTEAEKRRKEKAKSLADRSIFELKLKKRKKSGEDYESREYNANVGFAVWNKALENVNAYGYQETPDDKLKQCMKSFMKFLHETERLSEDGVKAELVRIVSGWVAIPESARVIQATTKEGKPYQRRLPDVPDFRLFYFNAAPIRSLITRYVSSLDQDRPESKVTESRNPASAVDVLFGDA